MTTPNTPTTPHDDTLATEVFVDTTGPTDPPVAASTPTAASTATATAMQPARPPEPTYLRGPAPFAITLGLLGLVIAGATFLTELTDVTLPWTDLGPWTVVAAGLVVLIVGAIGLRGSRTRD